MREKSTVSENCLVSANDKFTWYVDNLQFFEWLGTQHRMLHFNITSAFANGQDLTEQVRSGFENADLVLVQGNGLRFEDNEITRGISITHAWYTNIVRLMLWYKQIPQRVSVKSLKQN